VFGAVFSVCGLAMLVLMALQRPQPGQYRLAVAMAGFALGFVSFGFFCLIESTIRVSVESGELSVRRRIGFLGSNKKYSAQSVNRVFTRSSGKGSGLSMELSSGRKRNLTLFTEYADPAEQAGRLNHFIRTAAKRRR
jgi:hypothetical protein